MKMKQVADLIGKHDNTIRNYAKQFAPFLSPEPGKGEVRIFTDDDVRVLAFISRLSASGLSYDDINEAVQHKVNEGTPSPPVIVPPPREEAKGLITVPELEARLALKDAKIGELERSEEHTSEL